MVSRLNRLLTCFPGRASDSSLNWRLLPPDLLDGDRRVSWSGAAVAAGHALTGWWGSTQRRSRWPCRRRGVEAINSEECPCSTSVLKLQEQTYIGEISVSLKKGNQYQLTLADAVSVSQIHRILWTGTRKLPEVCKAPHEFSWKCSCWTSKHTIGPNTHGTSNFVLFMLFMLFIIIIYFSHLLIYKLRN